MTEVALTDKSGYLARMEKPLQEKLKIREYISPQANRVLDVGCADGAVTVALAKLFPQTQFLGVDRNAEFIEKARARAKEAGALNVTFEVSYISDLFNREERYDSILLVSVEHEIYTYDGGMPAVLRSLAGAHLLLAPGGDIVIRDMMLPEYKWESDYLLPQMLAKVLERKSILPMFVDFKRYFGQVEAVGQLNHFLLKYMYEENWAHEGPENYMPISVEEYQAVFKWLEMDIIKADLSLLPYLRGRWKDDFGFDESELDNLFSTGFVVARRRT